MSDLQYKSQLGWHAGFYFIASAIAYLVLKYGFRGLIWRDALYLVSGCLVASVLVGNLNLLISQSHERRVNEKYIDMTRRERLMGSERTAEIAKTGRRLGTLITLIAVGAGLVATFAFDKLLPR